MRSRWPHSVKSGIQLSKLVASVNPCLAPQLLKVSHIVFRKKNLGFFFKKPFYGFRSPCTHVSFWVRTAKESKLNSPEDVLFYHYVLTTGWRLKEMRGLSMFCLAEMIKSATNDLFIFDSNGSYFTFMLWCGSFFFCTVLSICPFSWSEKHTRHEKSVFRNLM